MKRGKHQTLTDISALTVSRWHQNLVKDKLRKYTSIIKQLFYFGELCQH